MYTLVLNCCDEHRAEVPGVEVILYFRSHLDAFGYLDSHVSEQLFPARTVLCGAHIISYGILEEPGLLHFSLER